MHVLDHERTEDLLLEFRAFERTAFIDVHLDFHRAAVALEDAGFHQRVTPARIGLHVDDDRVLPVIALADTA